jgi:hypothetical protein
MKAPRRVIRHPSELDALSVLPIKRMPGQRRVAIAEHLIASPQREEFESELNRRLFACGCEAATAGVLLAAAAYAVWAFVTISDVGILGHIGRGLLAAIVGGFIGKLAGLVAAENRLKQTISDVRRAIPATAVINPKPLPEQFICY